MGVPQTGNGYMLPQISIEDPHLTATRRLRPRPQPASSLMASSNARKGYELVPNKTAYGTSTKSLQQQPAGTVEGNIFNLHGTCCERIQHAFALGFEQSCLTPLA